MVTLVYVNGQLVVPNMDYITVDDKLAAFLDTLKSLGLGDVAPIKMLTKVDPNDVISVRRPSGRFIHTKRHR